MLIRDLKLHSFDLSPVSPTLPLSFFLSLPPSSITVNAWLFDVVFQLYNHFEEFNRVNKHYKYNLPESEVLDITERLCGGEEKVWER